MIEGLLLSLNLKSFSFRHLRIMTEKFGRSDFRWRSNFIKFFICLLRIIGFDEGSLFSVFGCMIDVTFETGSGFDFGWSRFIFNYSS